ncbi:hypothetical protein [Sphingomonas sp.]|jgi:hypothetical protein|uniref:hypothetical protein n=1 Tax=Sphingomonas sp. TaxID=28214 RepID=UPI002ED8D264
MRSLIVLSVLLMGCGNTAPSATTTLYRNSSMSPTARVHFATFDAQESDPTYNSTNCAMAAKLLNANIKAMNDDSQPVGFWCEPGSYDAEGLTPATFDAKFPTE